jgi:hypothetical protein
MLRGPFVNCTPDLAAKVLREGIDYAHKLGFKPHRDYYDASLLVGGDPDASDETVPLGQDGKPLYIAGPYDNPERIIRTLDKTVGPGNYHFTTFLGSLGDFPEADELEYDEDEDEDENEPDPWAFLPPAPAEPLPIRQVKVDLDMLYDVMMEETEDDRYLDIETGQIVTVPAEIADELESIYEQIDWTQAEADDDAVNARITELINATGLPEATKAAMMDAHKLDSQYGERYLPISSVYSLGLVLDMQAFIESQKDRKLRDRLQRAIGKKDYLAEFERELQRHPGKLEEWTAFRETQQRQSVLRFLESWGCEPVPA